MPLELGLAVAWQKLNPEKHVWFVFEARQRRIEKSMSDLNGSDVHIHGGQPKGLLSELANAFIRSERRADVEHMHRVFLGAQKGVAGFVAKGGNKIPLSRREYSTTLRILAAGAQRSIHEFPESEDVAPVLCRGAGANEE